MVINNHVPVFFATTKEMLRKYKIEINEQIIAIYNNHQVLFTYKYIYHEENANATGKIHKFLPNNLWRKFIIELIVSSSKLISNASH